MMKRFSTSCCLITFFLLNSVMLYAQHENTSVQQWKIEDESRALQMIERAVSYTHLTLPTKRIV